MSNSFTVFARCSAKVVSSSFCKHATVYGILLPAFVQSDRGEASFCFCLSCGTKCCVMFYSEQRQTNKQKSENFLGKLYKNSPTSVRRNSEVFVSDYKEPIHNMLKKQISCRREFCRGTSPLIRVVNFIFARISGK